MNTKDYEINRAEEKDIPIIEDILLDVVKWMKNNKLGNLWNESSVKWDILSRDYDISNFYICRLHNKPVGCMALTDSDINYWPGIAKGDALYIHKLAVKREFSGKGVSGLLIDYTKELAKSKNIESVRLDCNKNRDKLRTLYEKHGFVYTDEVKKSSGYTLALYVCKL